MIRNALLRLLNQYPYKKIGRLPTFVVCAAVKVDGVVYPCRRHGDAFKFVRWKQGDDGFIDNEDNFLTRSEAYAIAHKMGQIRVYPPKGYIKECKKKGITPDLFSENLY